MSINTNIELVKMKNSAKRHQSKQGLKDFLVKSIMAMGSGNELSRDTSLLKWVCNSIEAGYDYKNNKEKINKKELAIEVLTSVFPELNNDVDKQRISELINFLHDNGDIHKLSSKATIHKYVSRIGSFFFTQQKD